ncbi:phospho-sugar mutase [Cellulomonas soli]|uniref:Phosphomannomutase n=1 Tax=Cellulomonas soli TaxID=931535 RepID=A0A512PFQ0_9CELL|nr:phospho-sugar mutase [Cellulomonas soli]NYI59832.1 phosphomannomutase [Cellulomonas soli]GEP70024.1 phosphomannomutase [Cellulomonas soli]
MTGQDAWDALEQRVQTWIDDDPDERTAAELRDLLTTARSFPPTSRAADEPDPTRRQQVEAAHAAQDELADRFQGLLQFGTAGLRGELAGGPHRMNRAVVIRAASGLADFLLGELDGVQPAPRVVIGYDARHLSDEFARDSAAVLTAVGIEVLLMPSPLPTPVLAFAVRHLGADAGIMVTASHNPPRDNGYKVYLGGRVVTDSGQGAQIVPPTDAAIAAEIGRVPSVAAVPRASAGWTVLGTEIVDAYVASVTALAEQDAAYRARAGDLRIVLTPLHGVGGATAARVLAEAGYTDVHLVPEQAEPDPDFPTVAFPNPEEPGAIDLALGLAGDERADLVIALDPDADRCAVAVQDLRARSFRGPDTAGADGWRMLHGDETGALLGAVGAQRAAAAGLAPDPDGDTPALASSIVSSRLLGEIAASAGLRHVPTLTGFKWISRVDGLVFGYEEALGYCVDPAHVRDKDGISAALTVAGLAARLKAEGRTLVDALDDLARAHGLYLTDQVSARFADLSLIPATMQRVRDAPPTHLGGSPVTAVVDLAAGTDDDRGGLPPTDGLRLLAEDGTRVVVRPSGTEPKVKCYLEVIEPVAPDADHAAVGRARATARHRLDAVAADVRGALGI